MKNREFYVEQILECIMHHNCSIAIDKNTGRLEPCDIFEGCENCKLYSREMSCKQTWLKWLEQEHEEQILTKKEKTYLENVVKPFKERVDYIVKNQYSNNQTFICINVKLHYDDDDSEFMYLPYFSGDKMYIGMEYLKHYTMKDLGLFNDEKAEGGE